MAMYLSESQGHRLHREGTGAELLQEGRSLLVRLRRDGTAIYLSPRVALATVAKYLQPLPIISNHRQISPNIANGTPTWLFLTPSLCTTMHSIPPPKSLPSLRITVITHAEPLRSPRNPRTHQPRHSPPSSGTYIGTWGYNSRRHRRNTRSSTTATSKGHPLSEWGIKFG